MIFKSVKKIISNLNDLIFKLEDQDTSHFVDESLGRMKQQEVLDIVLPIAEKAHYIQKSDSYRFGYKEMGLFSDEKNDRLVWIVNFEWLETDGKSMGDYLDTAIASIKVDDATGKICSVWQKGMNSEMNYSDFLKLLDEKDAQQNS